MPGRTLSSLTFSEALDNLSTLAVAEVQDPYRLGILNDRKLVIQDTEISYPHAVWLTLNSSEDFSFLLRKSFHSVYFHLFDLVEKEEVDWGNLQTIEGLKVVLTLTGEAAGKADEILFQIDPKKGKNALTESEEYKEFLHFYKEQLAKQYPEILEGAKAWEKEWLDHRNFLIYELTQKGLKDFDTVRMDQEYELFYLKDEEGKSFFSPHLIRNIKLVCDFEQKPLPLAEDPLLLIPDLQDKDRLATGMQILQGIDPFLKDFYQMKIRRKSSPLIQALNKGIMALMLSADSKNLLENRSRKRAVQYFENFREFLREALTSDEYLKWIAYPPEKKEKLPHLLLNLTHLLCRGLLDHISGIKKEMIGLIHRLARLGRENQKKKDRPLFFSSSFFNELLIENEAIQELLSCYPSGPLLKILDVIRGEEEKEDFFAPLWQQNPPYELYRIQRKKKQTKVLKIPSPTYQTTLAKPSLVGEFQGFLRDYIAHKKVHLLINLQDRTSWKERPRANLLENSQNQAEFYSYLYVVSLTKDTDFYFQSNDYQKVEEASSFIHSFYEQLKNFQEYGFFFPKHFNQPAFFQFLQKLLSQIHQTIFEGKQILTLPMRLDFIEIAYQFILLKIYEELSPDSMSFTCKDALDVGSAAAFLFFVFLKGIKKQPLDKDQDWMRFMLQAPTLMVRERGIHPGRLSRVLSAANTFLEGIQKKKALSSLLAFYEEKALDTLSILVE